MVVALPSRLGASNLQARTPPDAAKVKSQTSSQLTTSTNALRESLGLCLVTSEDDLIVLTRSYQIGRRPVPVRGVQIYGMNMGCKCRWGPGVGGAVPGSEEELNLPNRDRVRRRQPTFNLLEAVGLPDRCTDSGIC